MTRAQIIGVLLIVLGLVYALLYAGWLRRARRSAPAAGTYLGTTKAISRRERVDAGGRGLRAPATMVVAEGSIRWEREGSSEILATGTRLLAVSLERSLASRLSGKASIVMVVWHADNGDRFTTGFLPHRRADSAELLQAVERLIRTGAATATDDESLSTQAATGIHRQVHDRSRPDGTP